MIHSARFICVLDTNVIYPIEVRDLLFWFAFYELYTPKWSTHIFDEWDVIMKRKGVSKIERTKRIAIANKAFPDARVVDYEPLMSGLLLPDKDDKHVLAAAIKASADMIVTNNIKDFPEKYLSKFDIQAKTADAFLTDTIDLNPVLALEAFKKLVDNRSRPNLDANAVIQNLQRNGLKETSEYLAYLV